MNGFEKAMYMLPEKIQLSAANLSELPVEEIRLRVGRKPTALYNGAEHELNCDKLSKQDLGRIIERITGASLHTAAPSICEGYVNFMGLRVGLCGKAVLQSGGLIGLTDFSSVNIRIPRECRGICDGLINDIYIKGFKNTLFISSPGLGKTTALREVIRVLSERGVRIGVVDERNELSATEGGIAQFNLGSHSDVLVNVPKAKSAIMLLKAMNEDVIAMDEISSEADIDAVSQIFGCGVGILATAHASCRDELYRRPLYRRLLDMKVFTYLVSININGTSRSYKAERL